MTKSKISGVSKKWALEFHIQHWSKYNGTKDCVLENSKLQLWLLDLYCHHFHNPIIFRYSPIIWHMLCFATKQLHNIWLVRKKKGSLRSHAAWAWAHGIMGGCSRPVFSHGKRVVSPCCEWWKCKRPVLPSTCQGTKWQLGGFKPAPKNRRVASGDVTLIAIENECFIWFYGKIMGIYGDTLW